MENEKKVLRFLICGAHPDDPDADAGGLAIRMRKKGHEVFLLSLTNGNAGHQTMAREPLKQRRAKEMQGVARVLDATYDTLDIDDGYLVADIPTREKLMRYIRTIRPDVIIAPRSCDYHPDHRAVGQLVCDCSYMVGVPLFCPDLPAMHDHPLILSAEDRFTYPAPFRADIAVPLTEEEVDKKIAALLEHESQYYEWLAYDGDWTPVLEAKSKEEATAWLYKQERERFSGAVKRFPDLFPAGTKYGEVFQIDEYGGAMTEELRRELTE